MPKTIKQEFLVLVTATLVQPDDDDRGMPQEREAVRQALLDQLDHVTITDVHDGDSRTSGDYRLGAVAVATAGTQERDFIGRRVTLWEPDERKRREVPSRG